VRGEAEGSRRDAFGEEYGVTAPNDLAPFGIAVGHASDVEGATGLTVVRGLDGPFRCGAAIIGRATGSRELHAVSPSHAGDRVDAVLLTGGSAYGLDAAAGVMRWMEERKRGYAIGGGVVPIVPAAVIFDLRPLGQFDRRPTPQMAYDACEEATTGPIAEGSVGVGTGATVGKAAGPAFAMKGGFGCATLSLGGVSVAAMVAVNALGDVRDGTGKIIAGARAADGSGFADSRALVAAGKAWRRTEQPVLTNTTIAVVAVDIALSKLDLTQLAAAASAALYRRITPTGTSVDGDIIFAVGPLEGRTAPVMQAEVLAAMALEDAIERAVRAARGRDGIPGLADQDA
jgi:L-aminopeptidase/D-esterase-like protein